jgi:aspartate-semialdehyde dehydrogenase
MPSSKDSPRIVIVGATTLRGKELVDLLKERIPLADLKLLDEEIAAGILTEAAGEPAVIQSVDPESFENARIVFFAGKSEFAAKHADGALRDSPFVIDLSGGLRDRGDVPQWIPSLDAALPPARPSNATSNKGYYSPSAPAIISCALAAGLMEWSPTGASIVFLQPVSERGQEAIEELEKQTVSLLSFQPIGKTVYDAQVAFNVMDRYGDASTERLGATRESIARDVANYLGTRAPVPAIQLLQAPVFHSHGFSAFAELKSSPEPVAVEKSLAAVGFKFPEADESAPSLISAAGEARPLLGHVERDPNRRGGYWFWGAADNLRVTAENAVAIAERLLQD